MYKFACQKTSGCTFVANDGIEKWPLIGWLCTINNTIFVSRENRFSVGDQVDDLRDAMSGEQPVTIFPEGTTHDGSGLLPFKPSLFAALVPPPQGMMVSQCSSLTANTLVAFPGWAKRG